jgi:hypothetical protein
MSGVCSVLDECLSPASRPAQRCWAPNALGRASPEIGVLFGRVKGKQPLRQTSSVLKSSSYFPGLFKPKSTSGAVRYLRPELRWGLGIFHLCKRLLQ